MTLKVHMTDPIEWVVDLDIRPVFTTFASDDFNFVSEIFTPEAGFCTKTVGTLYRSPDCRSPNPINHLKSFIPQTWHCFC